METVPHVGSDESECSIWVIPHADSDWLIKLLKDFVKKNILRQRLSRFLTCSFCYTNKFFHRNSFIFWQVAESC